jgi:D-sedoheptulose 7-phosphate isomerase
MNNSIIQDYQTRLQAALAMLDKPQLVQIAERLCQLIENKQKLFICGNGGSAGNAIHLANDFIFGVNPAGNAIDAEALAANSAVITCLANDIGYENIFAHQLIVKAHPGDMLLVLSGSGNSPNIIRALQVAKQQQLETVAVLGYDGGKAKQLADHVVHFDLDDMQIAEDMQLIVGHILMRLINLELRND